MPNPVTTIHVHPLDSIRGVWASRGTCHSAGLRAEDDRATLAPEGPAVRSTHVCERRVPLYSSRRPGTGANKRLK